jgi:hypothetical protein
MRKNIRKVNNRWSANATRTSGAIFYIARATASRVSACDAVIVSHVTSWCRDVYPLLLPVTWYPIFSRYLSSMKNIQDVEMCLVTAVFTSWQNPVILIWTKHQSSRSKLLFRFENSLMWDCYNTITKNGFRKFKSN